MSIGPVVPSAIEARRIAPLWKRWIASLLDSLPLLVVALLFERVNRGDTPRGRRPGLDLVATALSGAYHIAFTTASGQTIGQRVVGIRVVDEKTAALPNARQSALRWALASVPHALGRLRPMPADVERTLAAMADLAPEIERLTQRHRGDRHRLNEALIALYEERDVNPVTGWWPILLRALPGLVYSCALHGPALRGPLHQGVHDQLAGTVVVEQLGSSDRAPG